MPLEPYNVALPSLHHSLAVSYHYVSTSASEPVFCYIIALCCVRWQYAYSTRDYYLLAYRLRVDMLKSSIHVGSGNWVEC